MKKYLREIKGNNFSIKLFMQNILSLLLVKSDLQFQLQHHDLRQMSL